jgi:hypothetical protein
MHPFRVLLLCALVCSCHRPPQARQEHRITDPKKLAELQRAFVPEAYLRPEDQKKAERLRDGYSGPFPCSYDKVEGGVHVIASLPTDQCFKMTKPERIRGYWSDQFEGSQFCAAPTAACFNPEKNSTWLEFADPKMERREPTGALYAVEFIGRRPLYSGTFGHFGMFQNDVIVDRVISMKEIERPPRRATKAEMIKHFKECEAQKTCIPDWGYINAMKE